MAKKQDTRAGASAAQKAVGRGAKRKKKKGGGTVAAVVAAVLLAITLLGASGVFLYGQQLQRRTTIFPNVRVAGVEVGGMTAAGAREAVDKAVADAYTASSLQVNLPDRTITFEPEQANVALDADMAIEEAMDYGREGNAFETVIAWLDSRNMSHDIQLQTALKLDTAYIRSTIEQVADDVKRTARNSEMIMAQDSLQVKVGTEGQRLDTEGLYEAVYHAFMTGDFTPLTWDYEILPYGGVDLATMADKLCVEAQDAWYEAETHTIHEGSSGYGFDLAEAEAMVAAAESGSTVTIPLVTEEPAVTASQLEHEMFGEKLESRSSQYVNNAKRTENLRLACEAINGTILNPGEVFSFNGVVGERTPEKGYQDATVYGGDGESVDAAGGGVCQVASTIYYCTLYMNLEQVERAPHMYQVTYVPPGMDATVYWDTKLDYRFRNSLEHPVKIEANIEGGSVNITFWGVKENANYVEMTYKVLETFTEEDVEEVDETKPVGYRELKQTAYTGAKVEAYQKVFDSEGNLLEERTIKSDYIARPRIYVVGPAAPAEPELPEEFPEEYPGGDPDETPEEIPGGISEEASGEYPEGYWP